MDHWSPGQSPLKGALAYRKQPLQKWALLFCYYFLYIIIIIIMYRIKFSFKWYLFCGFVVVVYSLCRWTSQNSTIFEITC